MDEKENGDHLTDTNGICRLEWIAWAIDAARRHKEEEQRDTVASPLRAVTTPLKLDSVR
jgi:hypothetical protein